MEITETSFPPEMTQFVRNPYWEVFTKSAAPVYAASLIDNLQARTYVATQGTTVLGGYRILEREWSSQILDFAVLPAARGKQVASKLMFHIREGIAYDKQRIFLDTRVYRSDNPFTKFLVSMGFQTYKPYHPGFSEAEWLAYKVYQDQLVRLENGLGYRLHDDDVIKIVAHRMLVIERDLLHDHIKSELKSLTSHQKEIVLNGLKGKLGHFKKSSKLSYQYDVCPICKDIGSTVENPKCGECYLKIGCKEPFHLKFRHDPQVGALYFTQMEKYLKGLNDADSNTVI
jgi:hypothetical protein